MKEMGLPSGSYASEVCRMRSTCLYLDLLVKPQCTLFPTISKISRNEEFHFRDLLMLFHATQSCQGVSPVLEWVPDRRYGVPDGDGLPDKGDGVPDTGMGYQTGDMGARCGMGYKIGTPLLPHPHLAPTSVSPTPIWPPLAPALLWPHPQHSHLAPSSPSGPHSHLAPHPPCSFQSHLVWVENTLCASLHVEVIFLPHVEKFPKQS